MFGENYVNVPFDQSQGKNMFLRVTNIKIMLNTNILGMTPTPLTFDMLYHHDLEKGRYPTAQYSLPYFTDSVKYPMDYLTSKTYSERVDFFFNKKRFNTMCRTFGTNYIDYTEGNGDDEEEEDDDSEDDDSEDDDSEDDDSVRTPDLRSSVGVRGLSRKDSPLKVTASNDKHRTESIPSTMGSNTGLSGHRRQSERVKQGQIAKIVRTPEQGGTTCAGVRGITGHGLPSKVIKKDTSNDKMPYHDSMSGGYKENNIQTITFDGKPSPVIPRFTTLVPHSVNTTTPALTRRNSTNDLRKNDSYNKPTRMLREAPFGGAAKDTVKQEMENADHNVRCMLVLLVPIADEFMNVFQSSYDQYILNKPSPELYTLRNIDPTMLLNPTWLPFYNYFAARKYAPPIQEISYIKQGGTKYAVTNVIWLNDIVNHPIYREFLTTFYEKNLEKQNNRPKIKTQLSERLQMFRGLIQRNQSTKNAKTTLFMRMFETLLQNVNITTKGVGRNIKTPNEQIESIIEQFGNDSNPDTAALSSNINKVVSAVTNPKDAAKRDSVIRMATSFAKIIVIYNKFIQNGKLSNADWFSMIDNIVSAYIEYSLYNESADKGMQINLKDDARIFTELYNQSLFIKALQLLDDFLHNRISRFDMNEKNLDGTPKSKLELDIIRIIKTSFPYYIKLNDDIVKHLRNVIEPIRRSSNAKLQSFLKNMFIPDKTTVTTSSGADDDQYALVEVYNKYIANTRKHIHKRFTDELMYTGVSTVVESDGSKTNTTPTTQKPGETPGVGNKPSGGDEPATSSYREIPEIYVYVNVVQKDEYEGSENRTCIMSDDVVANNLKRVLFANTMLDDSFPEVNPYRVFQFLKGSENKTPFNAENITKTLSEGNVEPNKSNSQSPITNGLKGGSKRPPRNTYKYVPKRFAGRNTRKHR